MENQEIIMYNINDIQKIFGIGRTRAYQLVNSNGFPALHLNRKVLIPKQKLNEWIVKNCGKTFKY